MVLCLCINLVSVVLAYKFEEVEDTDSKKEKIKFTKELKNINDMKYKGKTIIDFDIEYLFEEKVDSETGEIIKVPKLNVKGEQKKIKKISFGHFSVMYFLYDQDCKGGLLNEKELL